VAILVNPQSELIREPRLLVPGQVPLGPVKLSSHPLAAKVRRLALPGRRLVFDGAAPAPASVVDYGSVGTPYGLAGKSNTTSGDYLICPASARDTSASGFTIGVFAAPVATAARQDVVAQLNESSPYQQRVLAFNANENYSAASGRFAGWVYDTGRAVRSTANQVDGNWHVFAFSARLGPLYHGLYRDGVNCAEYQSALATSFTNWTPFQFRIGTGTTDPVALVVDFFPALTDQEVAEWSADPFCLLSVA
jgi:hypothetical protein